LCPAHARTCAGRRRRRFCGVVSGQTRFPATRRHRARACPKRSRTGRRHTRRMTPSVPLTVLVLVGVGAPALLLAALGMASLLNRPLPERWTGALAGGSMMVACAALLLALLVYGAGGGVQLLSYGAWSASQEGGIGIDFLVDRRSLAFAALSAAI